MIIVVPILALLFYFYFQDKHKEPWQKLAEVFLVGMLITLQADYLQDKLLVLSINIVYESFVVAGLTEETVKFLAIKYMIYRDAEFNEQVDGIIFAVVFSLGFALVENIPSIIDLHTGLVKAFIAIPAHTLFGAIMGSYLGKHKFQQENALLIKALLLPVLLHGIYDFIILSNHKWGLFLFIPYFVVLWFIAVRITELSLAKLFFRR